MPMLKRSSAHPFYSVNVKVSSTWFLPRVSHLTLYKNILFKFSAQHDCRKGQCLPTAVRAQMQERQETTRKIHLIAHADDDYFVINLHGLHNATLLRKILPRSLTAPRPLFEDRKAQHFQIAATLRVTQTEKRARSAAKSKATREANAASKAANKGRAVVPNKPDEIEAGSDDKNLQESRKRRRGAH